VKKFNSSGVFQFAFGSTVSAGGQFQSAAGIAVDSSGNIYVADLGANVVRKFSSTGTSIGTIGSSGSGDGQFSGPVGIAIDSANNLYVADTGNNRIQKFNSAGTFVTKWGTMEAATVNSTDLKALPWIMPEQFMWLTPEIIVRNSFPTLEHSAKCAEAQAAAMDNSMLPSMSLPTPLVHSSTS
jgi:streptogramin lyase